MPRLGLQNQRAQKWRLQNLKVRILKDLIQALDDVILCGPLRLLLRLLRQARAPRRDAHVDAALLLQEGNTRPT